ncbi:MAG: phosphate/phosphite/phosphonate ABC transporter substrate-binding protein [Bdellovibrionota bacterium]
MNRAKNIFNVVLGLLLFATACTKPAPEAKAPVSSEATTIRLGLQPNEKAADLEAFTKELGDLTNLKVEIVVTKNYEELVDKFKSGSVDFAFFSPVNFISAEKDAGAKVLLKKVYGKSEFYYSALIVKADSKIKTVADLKGKNLAFVDPKSTSGYLYPLVMFKNAGFSVKDVKGNFAGTHDDAVKAVAEGRADAAAVWSDEPKTKAGAWTAYSEKNPSAKFRVLETSEPIPNDAFAVRSSFYQEQPNVVFRVMEGMIGMSDHENGALKAVFDTNKMTTATSRHYDSVRTIIEAEKDIQP